MKKALRIAGRLLVLLLVLAAGAFVWALLRSRSLRSRTIETHLVDFPIPFPLAPTELATLPPGENPDEAAIAAAVERGRHLVESRYVCVECHGQDFGGGVMIDDAMIGRILGPNITLGAGSRTSTYQASDWDRIVRHGVKPGGHPGAMPSEDFQRMSDQELSDIVTYIRSMPPVDNEVLPVRLGPLGTILLAIGQLPLSADVIRSHTATHPAMPPAASVTVEFGSHLAGVCMGCHGQSLAGGPIAGGDPSWPPAANLTPHVDGLAGWTFADFGRVLLQGTRPDGTPVREPMSLMRPYAENMTDVEMEALWAYLQSVTPVASQQ